MNSKNISHGRGRERGGFGEYKIEANSIHMKKKTPLHRLRYGLFNSGSVAIPKKAEMPIYLIIHELKLHMIYRAIQPVATLDIYMEMGLHKLILKQLKLLDGKDETYEFYFALLDKWTGDFNSNPTVVIKRALKIYNTLIKVRDARKKPRDP